MNSYLEQERKKFMKRLKYQMSLKRKNWEKIEIYLIGLMGNAFREGVYVGK